MALKAELAHARAATTQTGARAPRSPSSPARRAAASRTTSPSSDPHPPPLRSGNVSGGVALWRSFVGLVRGSEREDDDARRQAGEPGRALLFFSSLFLFSARTLI
jgi:hypothetical protein